MAIVPDHQSSTKLRDRAEECRVIARTYDDHEARYRMLGIAASYDWMAEHLEQGVSRPRSTTFPHYAPEELFRLIDICREELWLAEASRAEAMKKISASRLMIEESRNLLLAADLALRK